MPLILYKTKKFAPGSEAVIRQANEILDEYAEQGFDLTLRQLYYQFVSRALVRNNDREYKRLQSIISDARMAGRIDWDSIVDRTRNLKSQSHWSSPAGVIEAAAKGYRRSLWADQPTRVEVWIEKDALVGVIEGVCAELDVPYFSCRGYTSASEVWRAGQRLGGYLAAGQDVKIVHLGDHDPSGVDMTRDIDDRLATFIGTDAMYSSYDDDGDLDAAQEFAEKVLARFTVDRVALTWEQIELYDPPPNPAKLTDSRGSGYVEKYGNESWELDALEPSVMADLIREAVDGVVDVDKWNAAIDRQRTERAMLTKVSARWAEVAEMVMGDA